MRTLEEIKEELFSSSFSEGTERILELEQELLEYSEPQTEALLAACRGRLASELGNPSKEIEEWERAYHAFDRLGDRRSSAVLLGWLGSAQNNAGEYEQAIDTLNRAMAMYEELGRRSGFGHLFNTLGSIYAGLGDFPRSLEMVSRARAIHQENGARDHVLSSTMNIGLIYLNTGDYPTALEHFLECLSGIEDGGPTQTLENCLNNIGIVYYNLGEYSTAMEYFHRALEIARSLKLDTRAARCIGNIGNCLSRLGEYEAALANHQQAHDIYAANEAEIQTIGSLVKIASLRITMGSFDEADVILHQLESKPIVHVKDRIEYLFLKASRKEHIGDLNAAKVILEDALSLALAHTFPSYQGYVHGRLRELARSQNDLAGYIEHNEAYSKISEEIRGKETIQRISMQEAERRLAAERQETAKQLAVLHSTLPKHIADRVARGEVVNDHFDNAAVLFVDIVGFTTLSASMTSADVVNLLDTVFDSFDAICQKHGVTKIKTIGDSYMAVAFPSESSSSEQRVASAALDMLDAVSHIHYDQSEGRHDVLPKGLQVRIGLHTGPVTAGIIGKERMQYDVWGDTVNVASRMESTSEPGRIHVSSSFALALKGESAKERNGETAVIPSVSEERGSKYMTPGTWHMEPRGEVEIKGKGMMITYWLESIT